MSVFDPLDGWFESGFRIRAQSAKSAKRDSRRARSGVSPASSVGVQLGGSAKVRNITSVARKAPEVMVKITGNSSGLAAMKKHVDYISRDGKLELTNESGDSIQGRDELRALRDQFKAAQVPESSNKREFLHVVFSMPPGTHKEGLRDSVLQFCREEFANRRFVAALHDDTDHTHVHVCVSTRDMDRADEPRLSPRKADLFRWRQGFAEALREHGIDAAASDRRHRFQYRQAESSVVRQIRADNPASVVYNAPRAARQAEARAARAVGRPETAFVGPRRPPRTPLAHERVGDELREALRAGIRPENPAASNIEKSKLAGLTGWAQVARNLQAAGDTELARAVVDLMRAAKAPATSRMQELYDLARAGQDQTQEQGKARGQSQDKSHEL